MNKFDKAIRACDASLEQSAAEMLSLARKAQTMDEEISKLKDRIRSISKEFSSARSYVMSHSNETTPEISSKVKEATSIVHNLKNVNL